MSNALFNDMAQRLITFNKWEQRNFLERLLGSLSLPRGSRVLDFGCGTALFAPTVLNLGYSYVGYDIDGDLIEYASRLYSDGHFVSSLADAERFGPFQVILANCCFHHISDEDLVGELGRIKSLLAADGEFLLIDLLLNDDDPHPLRRLFRKLERGAFVRKEHDYARLVEREFEIKATSLTRSHVLSIVGNPVYNDMVVFRCQAQGVRSESAFASTGRTR